MNSLSVLFDLTGMKSMFVFNWKIKRRDQIMNPVFLSISLRPQRLTVQVHQPIRDCL